MSETVVNFPAKAPGTMQTFVETITPAQANAFLEKNKTNRDMRLTYIKRLAQIILRGEWVLTHQGIAITTDNELVDGQHRLSAIVMADTPVQMNVAYDVDPKSYMAIDNGAKRTHADLLRRPVMVTAVARQLWKLPGPKNSYAPTPQQLADVLAWSEPVIRKFVTAAGPVKTKRTSSTVLMPLVVHTMAGRKVLDAYVGYRSLDFDAMSKNVKNLVRQQDAGSASTRMDPWDVSARVWRAFDPDVADVKRLLIKDWRVAVEEMLRVTEVYRRKHG